MFDEQTDVERNIPSSILEEPEEEEVLKLLKLCELESSIKEVKQILETMGELVNTTEGLYSDVCCI